MDVTADEDLSGLSVELAEPGDKATGEAFDLGMLPGPGVQTKAIKLD